MRWSGRVGAGAIVLWLLAGSGCSRGPESPAPVTASDGVGTARQAVKPGGRCNSDSECDSDGQACHVGRCSVQHTCYIKNQSNGVPCDDHNGCTQGEYCMSGTCGGGSFVTCPKPGPCAAGLCNPTTGACDTVPLPNGFPCSDNSACTSGDVCQNGACVGTPVVCTSDSCHAPASCNPSTGACVPGKPLANGTPCSDGNGCTSGDSCQSGVCVSGAPATCSPPDACHLAGTCDPTSGACSFPVAPDGTACSDGSACTTGDVCRAGVCVAGTAKTCAPTDQCHAAGVCDPATGVCSAPPLPNGTPCNDGSACTTVDTCQAGVCTGAAPIVCTASDPCHAPGTCDPSTGQCGPGAPLPNGTACSDGNACTSGDSCQAGACKPGAAVTCSALDACHLAGTCNPTTGVCSNPPAPNGTSCSDGSACTLGDACLSGVCVAGTPKSCPSLDQCHGPGVCDARTGQCSSVTLPNGTACDDGNACTTSDSCQAGVCTGGTAKACAPIDGCHAGGTCNPSTGQCSTGPALADGTSCSDGNVCTTGDVCQAGVCTGQATVTCAPPDQCHLAGVCDPSTGQCSAPIAPDGTGCSDGSACTVGDVCKAGACVPGAPVVCAASDQCHAPGVCDPNTGACTAAPLPNGTPCDDGAACTTGDACRSGICSGAPVVCAAIDSCHAAGTCDATSGQCVTGPAFADGTACSDGNACTLGDTCHAGACVGGNAVACAAKDVCHVAGSCDPATGACSNPPAPSGTPCDDGNACTLDDACANGTCQAGAAKTCTSGDPCLASTGTCNPATGACTFTPLPDGTACSDGNGCTEHDTCHSGACVAGAPIRCTAPDDCHAAATCEPSTGLCSAPVLADGTACNDRNACTSGETCHSGVCSEGAVTACVPPDGCHAPGTCDPATGACAFTPLPDGTACDDANACTSDDVCEAGACVGGAILPCGPPAPCFAAGVCDPKTGSCSYAPVADGSACTVPDACGGPGTCDAAVCRRPACEGGACWTSQWDPDRCACLSALIPDGTACDDGDRCTRGETCSDGTCVGTPVSCAASDDPCLVNACDPATGACASSPAPSGTACSDGDPCTPIDTCADGHCVPGAPIACASTDPCHVSGCDPAIGACSVKDAPDGTACDDGDPCTSGDACAAGLCLGGAQVSCVGPPCTAGTCDSATGACVFTPLADGSACDDGDPCTSGDSCTGTVCGGTAVVCGAPDGCHVGIGVCISSAGGCVFAPAPDGTPCDDHDACTTGDACAAGVCGGAPVNDGGAAPVIATRRLDFFMTHEALTSACLNFGSVRLGAVEVDTVARALGLMWGTPAKFADGSVRPSRDRAELVLMRQLFVATCNERLFGATPSGTVDADARAAVGGTDCAAMGALSDALEAFNGSGAKAPLPPGMDAGPPTPAHAKGLAVDPTRPSGASCTTGGAP